ncbi:hypothetical protein, partial [Fischerella thermalis]|uniref:hypothetical protein n=1 Tax=Fischerella thermalis TaxID=372787 RepID=UPI001CA54FC6
HPSQIYLTFAISQGIYSLAYEKLMQDIKRRRLVSPRRHRRAAATFRSHFVSTGTVERQELSFLIGRENHPANMQRCFICVHRLALCLFSLHPPNRKPLPHSWGSIFCGR